MVLRRKFPTKLCPIPRQEAIHTECLRRSAEMHSLMAELGQMQRQQQEQLQRFSVNSAEETKEARQRFVELRDQLNRHSQRVEQSIAEADRLCVEGADSLAPEQFHLLKESRQRLHSTFESLSRQTDSVLARLDLATALLLEFTAKASAFQSWVYESGRKLDALRADSGHPNGLEESRRRFRTLNEEILAKRPELSGISQLAQRIEAEIGAYLDEMSGRPAGREGTPTRGTQLQKHHQVRDTVQRAQDDYEALLNSKQDFDQMLRRLGNFSMQYEQRLGEAHGWLDDLERAISHAAVGATGDIETRLANLLRLNQNAVEGQPKIDAAEAAAHQLDEATVQTDAHESLLAEHEEQIVELRRKYSTLSDRLKDGMDATRTEMTQREGLAQGLRQMDDWLGKMERKMGDPRRIQLNPTKLNELKYEDQLERGELESKERTLSELGAILRTQRAVKHLKGSEFEAQFGKATDRFRRIGSTARAHSDNLGDAIRGYEEWQREEAKLADHLSSLNEAIVHLDPSDMEMAEKFGQQLTELEASDWANLQELAKNLSQIPNVEGIDQITEKMRTHESLLARLRDALGSKLNNGHRLSQNRKQFWQKAQQIGNDVGQIEQRIQINAKTISGTPDQREAQRNECTELANNLGHIRQELEELEQMGSDLIRNGGAKKLSGKDGVDPVTKITGQLFELHRREEDAQRALNELQGQIAEFDSATQTWLMDAEAMNRWLDAENAKIGKGWATMNWEPRVMAEQRAEAQQGAQKQRKQQTKMTQLQMKYKELAGKGNETINGINEIDNKMRELERKWSGLEAEWANIDKCIGTAESLHRDSKRMEHWLGAKVNLLDGCTISAADVKLVDAQLGIVNILQTEMADERPRWNRLNDDAIETVRLAQSETFSARIVARMDELNRKWRELEKTLEMKLTALNEARTQISNFEQLQRDLRRDLRNLESSLNEAAAMKPGQSQQLTRLIEAQNELENQLRPSLEEMRILAENIQRIWNGDSSLRSDLDDRVDGMGRQIEELKMKLESVKKAAESASAAEEELNQELAELGNWVQSQKRELDILPIVSAEPNKLAEQIEQFQRPYADILAKEGCVIVAGSKAASLLSQTPSAELKRRLIHLNEIWPPLISAAKERHEKLGRTKKALDELIETEKEIKEKLSTLNEELATVKLAEKNSATGTLPITMESIHQRLISLGPCVESAFILMDKLERAVDGGSAETKKHRIALEQLRREKIEINGLCSFMVDRLRSVLDQEVQIHGRENFPTLEIPLNTLIVNMRRKLLEAGLPLKHVKLNGGAASYVFSQSEFFPYSDVDLIFPIGLEEDRDFERVRDAVFDALLEMMPSTTNKSAITADTLRDVYIRKMVKVTDGDRWSLFSLHNDYGRCIELKFVQQIRRAFEFSVDSFQITLDPLIDHPNEHRPIVRAESMYGDFMQALNHLNKRLIDTRNPEEIRGGGLLKYCHLLTRGFSATANCRDMEKYMCSRFFIDFPDINVQEMKLLNYLQNHFGNEDELKLDYLQKLWLVIRESTVCLMYHERRQTLSMVDRLRQQLSYNLMLYYQQFEGANGVNTQYYGNNCRPRKYYNNRENRHWQRHNNNGGGYRNNGPMLCVSPVSTIASSSLETEQSQLEQLSTESGNVEANTPQDQQNITTQNGSQKTGKEPPTITILQPANKQIHKSAQSQPQQSHQKSQQPAQHIPRQTLLYLPPNASHWIPVI